MKNWRTWWLAALTVFLVSWIGDAFMASFVVSDSIIVSLGLEDRNWWGLETIIPYAWFTLALTFIFIKGYEGGTWWEGIRFGTYMWALSSGILGMMGAIPEESCFLWNISLWAGFAIIGVILCFTYRPNAKA